MLTVKELHDKLGATMAAMPETATLPVIADGGDNYIPIEGGIVRTVSDHPHLLLAPLSLDQVGGF